MKQERIDGPLKTAAAGARVNEQQSEEAENQLNAAAEAIKERAHEFAEAQKVEGAKRFDRHFDRHFDCLGEAVHRAADELGKELPELAGFIDSAAENLQGVAATLHEHSIGDLTKRFDRFARQQPVAAFAGAMVAGFVLSRFLKSSPQGSPDEKD